MARPEAPQFNIRGDLWKARLAIAALVGFMAGVVTDPRLEHPVDAHNQPDKHAAKLPGYYSLKGAALVDYCKKEHPLPKGKPQTRQGKIRDYLTDTARNDRIDDLIANRIRLIVKRANHNEGSYTFFDEGTPNRPPTKDIPDNYEGVGSLLKEARNEEGKIIYSEYVANIQRDHEGNYTAPAEPLAYSIADLNNQSQPAQALFTAPEAAGPDPCSLVNGNSLSRGWGIEYYDLDFKHGVLPEGSIQSSTYNVANSNAAGYVGLDRKIDRRASRLVANAP